MAVGIIIHISIGKEKRTEFFSDENIRIGSDERSDLQIRSKQIETTSVWLELEYSDGVYRVINYDKSLHLTLNGNPIRRFAAINDGDTISIETTDVSFSFFSLNLKSSLITTNREQPHVAQFIEAAAIESAVSPKRDDAKTFLREFVRELSREISWTTKLIILVLAISFFGGILYLGSAVRNELRVSREQSEQQGAIIRKLEEKLGQTSDQIGELDKSNKALISTVSLAQNLRVEYGNGVCLIAGVYDLVDKRTGRMLRYPDPQALQMNQTDAAPMEGEVPMDAVSPQMGLTTEGNGSPVEYDFIGTGFHVGNGYIVTNRHVMQPWEEDDLVKQMMSESNGKARIKRLVIYFPNFPQPFPLRVRQLDFREDLAVASIDPNSVSPDIPVLPLEANSDAVAVGKTVVTMGYPSGPERLLAMVDEDEAKSINSRFGNSRQNLISFLAQSRKIVPLTTQGAITDLDARRIVHDAKTAEGGSGAPLFGQTGKVIGVNFGVFTQNTASNMAIPIRFAVDLLKKVGWKSPEEISAEAERKKQTQTASADIKVEKDNKPQ
ncbi:MAG TPA: trypsin-like peptidase domain-containing protein [Pyrinomonadaceae bacterium]|jgi:S1-C subfamily serine protease